MRYLKGASAFLAGSAISLFFRGPRITALMLPQIGILGATICIFLGTLRMKPGARKAKGPTPPPQDKT